jgi:hypothetical protein
MTGAQSRDRLAAGPVISKPSDLKIAQGMVNTSENGEVWPEPELIWGWYTTW